MLRLGLRKIRTFLGLSRFTHVWLLPLWFLLGVAKFLIFTISFRRLAPWLGTHANSPPWLPLLDARQRQLAFQVGQAIQVAAKYTPWESNCFPQAVVACWMLTWYKIPYLLYFGLRRPASAGDGTSLEAHAWVASDRIRVTGGTSFGQFTVVGIFTSALLTQEPLSP